MRETLCWAGVPFSPLNHCLRPDGRAPAPAGEGNLQGLEKKDVAFGAVRVYTVTVPGPKWKYWLKLL